MPDGVAAADLGLSPAATLVRRRDPDRFLTALFAPPAHRETLLLLYAVNHELARAREVAQEPTLALIRLHWWREIIEGARRRHDIAGPLGVALDHGMVPRAELAMMINGREAEAEPAIATLGDWHAYLDATAGALAVAAGRVLGARDVALERLRRLGCAYGIAGQLRNVAALARQGRCQLPLEVLGVHGLTADAVIADPRVSLPVLVELAAEGRRLLRDARGRLPRRIIAAGLPAVLARRDLHRPEAPPAPRGVVDKAAVVAAYLAGRL